MKCTVCGQECSPIHKTSRYVPEVIFIDEHNIICEECSIDYEEVNGKLQPRRDLIEEGIIFPKMKLLC